MIRTGSPDVPPPTVQTPRFSLSRYNAFQLTAAYSCLILVLMQLWRPHYFMGDDNLFYSLPIYTTMGQQLWHGHSPAFNPYLFNGFNLLSDPTSISLWNPLILLISLLGNTRFALAIVDIYGSVNLLLGSLAFTLLLCRLRTLKSLGISDGRIAFLSLSFTFSAYALSIGSCWVMFLANPTALSLMVLGLVEERRVASIRAVTAGLVFGILVGHLSPFLYTFFFCSILAVLMCWANRSWQPLQCWVYGGLLALLITGPLLFPAARGFLGSSRSVPYSLAALTRNSLPLTAFPLTFCFGYLGLFLGAGLGLFSIKYIYGLLSCAAAWQVFGGLSGLKKLSRLEIAVLITIAVVGLFILRPLWLAIIVSHTPLLRSLRWPFREIYVLLFFVHLWIALRPVALAPRSAAINSFLGCAVFAASLFVVNPWSFSPTPIDRQLLFSGAAQAYWERLKPALGPQDRIIAIADYDFTTHHHNEVPYVLLGAFNFPALFHVYAYGGYSAQGMSSAKMDAGTPYFLGSVYDTKVGFRLLAKNPHIKAFRLVSLHPPRIDLCSNEGCRAVALPQY